MAKCIRNNINTEKQTKNKLPPAKNINCTRIQKHQQNKEKIRPVWSEQRFPTRQHLEASCPSKTR
jgi:hypothetical protein